MHVLTKKKKEKEKEVFGPPSPNRGRKKRAGGVLVSPGGKRKTETGITWGGGKQ